MNLKKNTTLFQTETDNHQTQFEKIFFFIWVMAVVYLIVGPVTNNYGLLRMIWIPSLIILFVSSLRETVKLSFLFEFVITVSIIGFSFLAQKGTINLEHMLSAFCYINAFLLIDNCKEIVPTKKTFDFIFYSAVALSLIFAVYTFTPIAYRVHTNGVIWYSIYYVFDLGNSNLAGIYIFFFYCVLLINLAYRKRKILIILIMIYDLYMIYGTHCRSALFTALFVTIAFFLVGRIKLPNVIIILGILIPAFFIIFYLHLYNSFGSQGVKVLDKSLFTGRQNIFLDFLGYLDSPIKVCFGNFEKAGLKNGHNIIVSVLSSLGIFGLSAFYLFYGRILCSINKKEKSSIRTMSIICIIGLFIMSSAEASLFLGGFPGVVFVSSFVLLSNFSDYSPWKIPIRKGNKEKVYSYIRERQS